MGVDRRLDTIVGVDLKPSRLAASAKVAWLQADVSTDDWQTACATIA
jgi:hypothetical protein